MDDLTMYVVSWIDKNGKTQTNTISSDQYNWFKKEYVEANGGRVMTTEVKQDTITVTR